MLNWISTAGNGTAIAAGIAMLAAAWSYVRMAWSYLRSTLVVSIDCYDASSEAVLIYLNQQLKKSRLGPRSYAGWHEHIRPLGRRGPVAAELLAQGGMLFWKGWAPIWVNRISAIENNTHDDQTIYTRPIRLTFLRGTFSPDDLVLRGIDTYDAVKFRGLTRKYRVAYLSGTAGKTAIRHGTDSGGVSPRGNHCSPPSSVDDEHDSADRRLLRYRREDLGAAIPEESLIKTMAMTDEHRMALARLQQWKNRREWYIARSLSWKTGVLATGLPGTGKTTWIRAIAQELDLPVFVFDLSTFHNEELRECWTSMLAQAPCVALLEDIDNVFHGREPQPGVQLTFDCLLNCVDGIEQAQGLLLYVTTNRLELIDPALGGITAGGEATRPGRIDHVLQFHPLDADGRRHIAKRILIDWPGMWDDVVAIGDGDTGAQFENRCREWALRKDREQMDEIEKRMRESPGFIGQAVVQFDPVIISEKSTKLSSKWGKDWPEGAQHAARTNH